MDIESLALNRCADVSMECASAVVGLVLLHPDQLTVSVTTCSELQYHNITQLARGYAGNSAMTASGSCSVSSITSARAVELQACCNSLATGVGSYQCLQQYRTTACMHI